MGECACRRASTGISKLSVPWRTSASGGPIKLSGSVPPPWEAPPPPLPVRWRDCWSLSPDWVEFCPGALTWLIGVLGLAGACILVGAPDIELLSLGTLVSGPEV